MKTIVRLAAALATSATVLGGLAWADDLPPRKPGLWQVDMTMPGAPTQMRGMQMCIDATTDAAMYKMGMSASQGACSKNEIHRSGSTVTADAVCKFGDSQMTTQAVTKFTGDTAYHTDIHTKFDPPMMGRSESVMAQDAKWAGPCPPDLQPGDVVMANGMKMNIKTMAGDQ
jgi:hypothetical protein